jgi:hypothetical protein
MAPHTLRKKLDHLLSYKFIKQTPTNPRKGQKIKYFTTSAYKEYDNFGFRLTKEVDVLIKIFDEFEIKDEIDAEVLSKLLENLNKLFSIPLLTDSIQSWEPSWLYNTELMKEVLFIYYGSYMMIIDKIDKLLKNPKYKKYIINSINTNVLKLKGYESLYPTYTEILDNLDYMVYNLY